MDELKEKPFDDDIDFESFYGPQLETKISDEVLCQTNLNTPLNIFKFILLKLSEPLMNTKKFVDQSACKDLLKSIKKVKAMYMNFARKKVQMTKLESKYVKSAHATLELALIAVEIKGGPSKYPIGSFDFRKFKDICSSILDGFAGEVPLHYFLCIYDFLGFYGCYNVCHFILCVATKIAIKIGKRFEKDSEKLKNIENYIEDSKLILLHETFSISASLYTTGVQSKFECPINDSDYGKMLMEIFDKYDKTIEFRHIPIKAENYDQAKQIYELILKLFKNQKSATRDSPVYITDGFEGVAHSNFAAFQTEPAEIFKLCKKSMKILQRLPAKEVSIG